MKQYIYPLTIAIFILTLGCGEKAATSSDKTESSSAKTTDSMKPVPVGSKFSVKLETTKGSIIIDVHPTWAPIGAKRFRELVETGFYTNSPFFRVLDGFMAQAGINADPTVNKVWRSKKIKDDPVKESNQRGTVSFATAGSNSRTTQFFINYGDNAKLDAMSFTPFGKVREMDIVEKLYSEYGEGAPRGNGPSQKRLQFEGKPYWEKDFPNLDYIKSASIID